MNGKNKMMKKNNKSGMKGKNPNNKVTKNGFVHKKNFKSKFQKHKSNSKGFTYTPENKEIPPVEVQFAKKLAANEPNVRDKAIKKLKKWLTSRSNCDNDEAKSLFNKSEMLRLWKGLHYCFWMSDKPLVQEELAEKIASIIHCFKNDDASAILYMQCFLITLGREWLGIDKHRVDKFMMLTRRMIRQCFIYAADKEWNMKLLEDISSTFDVLVIGASRNSTDSSMALGFQLHVTDVYLEELAKASKTSESKLNQSLTDEMIQTLIKPFVNELTWGTEERLLSQIETRVFDHLIRQSDVAIEYEDDDEEEVDEEAHNESEDDSEPKTESDKSDNSDDEEGEESFTLDDADPRAGKGDVVLPQLKVDFEKISKILLEAGSKKEVSASQRQRLYRITKKLNHVATGIYPFALEMSEDGERLIGEKEFEEQERNLRMEEKKAAKRKFTEDEEYAANIREERKEYKQALKKKIRIEKEHQEKKVMPEKQDNSKTSNLQDDLSATRKNQSEYLDVEKSAFAVKLAKHTNDKNNDNKDMKDKCKKAGNRKATKNKKAVPEKEDNSKTSNLQDDLSTTRKSPSEFLDVEKSACAVKMAKHTNNKNNDNKEMKNKSKKAGNQKAIKNKKVLPEKEDNSKTSNLQDDLSTTRKSPSEFSDGEKSAYAVKMAKHTNKKNNDNKEMKDKSKKAGSQKATFQIPNLTSFLPPSIISNDKKSSKQAEKTKAISKKINFAMSENKCQSLLELDKSIQQSPNFQPYDAARKPAKPVLKTPPGGDSSKLNVTPLSKKKKQTVLYNTMINSKSKFAARAVASDFF